MVNERKVKPLKRIKYFEVCGILSKDELFSYFNKDLGMVITGPVISRTHLASSSNNLAISSQSWAQVNLLQQNSQIIEPPMTESARSRSRSNRNQKTLVETPLRKPDSGDEKTPYSSNEKKRLSVMDDINLDKSNSMVYLKNEKNNEGQVLFRKDRTFLDLDDKTDTMY